MDEKPQVRKIDPSKFGFDGLAKLKDLLGDVDEFASIVKGKAVKFDDTLTKFSDFTQKFGETIVGFSQVVEMNRKLIEDMMKRAEKAANDLIK